MSARLVVVSGPSGVGKSSLVRRAVALRPQLVLAVSATTRDPRPGEQDGRDYLFMSREAFADLDAMGGFLETAEVYGERYGTPAEPVEVALSEGKTVILEIDTQGAASVRRARPDAMLVFVHPPSVEALRERLKGRGTEDEASFRRRVAAAEAEMAEASWFDVSLVNDDLEDAAGELVRILETPPSAGGPQGDAHESG